MPCWPRGTAGQHEAAEALRPGRMCGCDRLRRRGSSVCLAPLRVRGRACSVCEPLRGCDGCGQALAVPGGTRRLGGRREALSDCLWAWVLSLRLPTADWGASCVLRGARSCGLGRLFAGGHVTVGVASHSRGRVCRPQGGCITVHAAMRLVSSRLPQQKRSPYHSPRPEGPNPRPARPPQGCGGLLLPPKRARPCSGPLHWYFLLVTALDMPPRLPQTITQVSPSQEGSP